MAGRDAVDTAGRELRGAAIVAADAHLPGVDAEDSAEPRCLRDDLVLYRPCWSLDCSPMRPLLPPGHEHDICAHGTRGRNGVVVFDRVAMTELTSR